MINLYIDIVETITSIIIMKYYFMINLYINLWFKYGKNYNINNVKNYIMYKLIWKKL